MEPNYCSERVMPEPALPDECLAQILLDLNDSLRLLSLQLFEIHQKLCQTPHGGLGRGGLSPKDYYAYCHGGPYE